MTKKDEITHIPPPITHILPSVEWRAMLTCVKLDECEWRKAGKTCPSTLPCIKIM